MSIDSIEDNKKKMSTFFLKLFWNCKRINIGGVSILERVFVMRHILVKPFRMLALDEMCMSPKPAKHLRENLNHKFNWETFFQAPKNYR